MGIGLSCVDAAVVCGSDTAIRRDVLPCVDSKRPTSCRGDCAIVGNRQRAAIQSLIRAKTVVQHDTAGRQVALIGYGHHPVCSRRFLPCVNGIAGKRAVGNDSAAIGDGCRIRRAASLFYPKAIGRVAGRVDPATVIDLGLLSGAGLLIQINAVTGLTRCGDVACVGDLRLGAFQKYGMAPVAAGLNKTGIVDDCTDGGTAHMDTVSIASGGGVTPCHINVGVRISCNSDSFSPRHTHAGPTSAGAGYRNPAPIGVSYIPQMQTTVTIR
ncbi:hypothetical protein CUZ56_03038 [Saezia sanguinis]|uniref:Uncharacterized protein n=1 Tax=Saezia sanguinis TaxID=1965230 RepID=A0A433S9I1_9BURK|nr:hypothetical protein CUZ56_03038 [Saezia sanguinis]